MVYKENPPIIKGPICRYKIYSGLSINTLQLRGTNEVQNWQFTGQV